MYGQQEICVYSNIRRFIATTSSWCAVYECYINYLKLDIIFTGWGVFWRLLNTINISSFDQFFCHKFFLELIVLRKFLVW